MLIWRHIYYLMASLLAQCTFKMLIFLRKGVHVFVLTKLPALWFIFDLLLLHLNLLVSNDFLIFLFLYLGSFDYVFGCQDSIKGKWENSGATKHCLKWHDQFNWLHPKTLSWEVRYKSRKIRESLEIKRSKCNSSKSNINHNDGNFVKTNIWTPLLTNINDLERALRNQRSHCKVDMTSN